VTGRLDPYGPFTIRRVTSRENGRRAWLWLAIVVVASACVRVVLGRQIVAPWIMVDELVYSDLAKSAAATGHFQIRGVAATGYGFVYPLLIAPAWKLFGSATAAYAAAKTINAVLMSLAAIPAYFLARRLVSPLAALCVSALAVVVPSMLYTGTLMTENAFYPLFVLVCLALVATLQHPTRVRQLGLLALFALAYATRQQAIVLPAAAAVAPAVQGALERDVTRRLRAWLPFYASAAAVVIAAVAVTAARGRSPLTLLGAYRAAAEVHYSAWSVAHYLLWHVGGLDLYVGVAPFAALLLGWLAAARRDAPAELQAFAAASLPLTVLLIAEVAVFASEQSFRIEERNIFYLAPFALVALLAVVEGRVSSTRATGAAAALVAAVLPATIPFERFLNSSATPDTLALLPWWSLHDHHVGYGALRWVALGASAVAGAMLFAPRTLRALPVVLAACYFAATTAIADAGRHGITTAARQTLRAGIHGDTYDWVDRAVGRGADVTEVWNGTAPIQTVWETEFFNRSVRRVASIGPPYPDGLPTVELRERADGALATSRGAAYPSRLMLVPPSLSIGGTLVASDADHGLRLFRLGGRAVVLGDLVGLYPGDVWSGRHVTYRRRRCRGGRIEVALQSDPRLYDTAQTVTATEAGRAVARVEVPPDSSVRNLDVPLQPRAGTCVVGFTIAQVRVPARVERGATDTRALGVRFLGVAYSTR